MRTLFRFIGTFFRDQWRQFTPTGQLLYSMFLVAICVDAGIAYQYGISMSGMHAAGFALVAVAFAVLPDIAAREVDRKAYYSAVVIGAVCLPLGVTSYQSHIGYGAGVRLGDMQETGVQLTKVKDIRGSLESDRTNLDLWRKQLANLLEQNAWAATVKADGLRAQIEDLKRAEASEAKLGGCGQKCRSIQNQITDVQGRIAIAEQASDLTRRIEATQRVLDRKTEVAIDTKPRHSVVVNQNTALGQLWHLVMGQEVEDTTVNLAATGNAAIAFLALAPILGFAAGRNRWRRYMLGTHENDTDDDLPPSAAAPVTPQAYAGIPGNPIHVHTVEQISDPALKRWSAMREPASLADQVRGLLNARPLEAATA